MEQSLKWKARHMAATGAAVRFSYLLRMVMRDRCRVASLAPLARRDLGVFALRLTTAKYAPLTSSAQ
jgi:hypothetical protein